jgi:hypothetical protein
MTELQALGSQAQPCYEPNLKSLFNLLGKSLHLFCKDCDRILECGIFCLVVRDGHRGGDGGGGGSGRQGGDGTGSGSALRSRLSLKAGQADPGEVTSAAAVVADRRAGMLLQAVFVQLQAAATTAILHPFAPLLHDVLVGQSLEVGVDVVGIDVHRVRIAETGGGARGRGRVVTGCACLALVVVQVRELQIDGVAVGLESVVVFGHDREVGKPIDVIGVQGLLEAIKQILFGPAGSRGPGLKVCYKLAKSALALLHPDDLVLRVGLGTDRLELQFERHKEGISARKRRFAFGEGFDVESGPHRCVFGHEEKGRGNHLVYVQHGDSISTLDLLFLRISERKPVFVCVNPNAESTPKQSGGLRVLALENDGLLDD